MSSARRRREGASEIKDGVTEDLPRLVKDAGYRCRRKLPDLVKKPNSRGHSWERRVLKELASDGIKPACRSTLPTELESRRGDARVTKLPSMKLVIEVAQRCQR